jgi:phosphodiesterase/alkaline phosphatase D-like protein
MPGFIQRSVSVRNTFICASFALLVISFGLSKSSHAATVEFIWSGGVTTTSVIVKAKLSVDGSTGRLMYSTTPDFSSPNYSAYETASTATTNRVVTFSIAGLSPNTQYYYACEVDGVIDAAHTGRFHTNTDNEASFTFALASCALTGSNHAVFETIRQRNPLFFFHMGDMHYQNIGVNDRNVFRQAYETVLTTPNQARLFRDVPIAYVWDDHDFGPNNSDSTAPGRTASRLTYREYVPHHPLAAGDGDAPIYRAFTIGRVRFIVTDCRSLRSPYLHADNPSKTMLGIPQKAWFKQELLNARGMALTVWVNSLPWIGVFGDDGWYAYTYERKEIADFIKDNGITNLCMISGDAHMVAIDNGTNSDYATGGGGGFPVFHAGALDRSSSVKGGPYSEGAIGGGGQFGLFTVNDLGDSVQVIWSARNYLNAELIRYSFSRVVCPTIDPEPGSYCDCCVSIRGDVDGYPGVTLLDIIKLLSWLFTQGPSPSCMLEANVDGLGGINVVDLTTLVNYMFLGGQAPAPCP